MRGTRLFVNVHTQSAERAWCQRCILLALRLPAAKQKVDAQLAEAQLKIENSLVAKGPDVVRHLALPIEGRSPEWIAQEMEKMDKETEKSDKWKLGRLSGAVYRESHSLVLGPEFVVLFILEGSSSALAVGKRCCACFRVCARNVFPKARLSHL